MKTQVTIKSWTKSEMIDKIFEQVKWSETRREVNKKKAMRKSYDSIWNIFDHYQKEPAQYLFYVNLLIS